MRSGAIDVVVVDSVAALVPRAEIEGEMGDSFVGLHARLMSQALRKLTGVINWSWLWVLAPIWIPTAITLAIIVIVLVAILVRELTKGGRP